MTEIEGSSGRLHRKVRKQRKNTSTILWKLMGC